MNFGFECPDLFELAVDGGEIKKWVVMDASSKYLIGGFDGAVFTPDTGGPWKMDLSPDFYASQTFFRNTFPDTRVIQMAWMRGTLGAPWWTHEASFPCEIRLATFAEGIRATRFPIAEICSLYASTEHWDGCELSPGSNLLSKLKAKCFDLRAEFDLAGATATAIDFAFPNKTVTYDIANATLLGQSLRPINNRVKIRLLVDWGELEAFGNDGLFSWTQNVKFTPADGSLCLSVNGNVNLVAMDLHEIKRAWRLPPLTPEFSTNLTGAWTPLGGEWMDTETGKQGRCGEEAFCLNSRIDSNVTYEGDITLLFGNAGALVFRANADASAGYRVGVDAGFIVQLWGLGRGELARSIAPITAGPTAYHLKAIVTGNNIKVYYNAGTSPVIDYTDTLPAHGGRLGLYVRNGAAVFQNVTAGETASIVHGDGADATKGISLTAAVSHGPAGKIRIVCSVPDGMPRNVSLDLFDLRGKLVRRLVNGAIPPGNHTFLLNRHDKTGGSLLAGTYVLRLRTTMAKKVTEALLGRMIAP